MSTERETAAGAKYWERPLYEQTRAIVSKAAQEYADANSKTDCVNWATREVLALLAPQPRSTEGAELVERINEALVDPITRRAAGMNTLTRHLCELLQESTRLLASPADARETLPAEGEVEPDELREALRAGSYALLTVADKDDYEGFPESAQLGRKWADLLHDLSGDGTWVRAKPGYTILHLRMRVCELESELAKLRSDAEPDGALREALEESSAPRYFIEALGHKGTGWRAIEEDGFDTIEEARAEIELLRVDPEFHWKDYRVIERRERVI